MVVKFTSRSVTMNPYDATGKSGFNLGCDNQGFIGFKTIDGAARIKALLVRADSPSAACAIESVTLTVSPFDPACCA